MCEYLKIFDQWIIPIQYQILADILEPQVLLNEQKVVSPIETE